MVRSASVPPTPNVSSVCTSRCPMASISAVPGSSSSCDSAVNNSGGGNSTPSGGGGAGRGGGAGFDFRSFWGAGSGALEAMERGGSSFVATRSEEHTSELQSHSDLVCRLLLEKKKKKR